MRRIALLSLLVLLAACKPSIPKQYLQPDEMEDILFDYHVGMGMAEQAKGNYAYNKIKFKNEVFKKHGITEAEFDSSMVYYMQHTLLLSDIYKDLQERLGKEAMKYGASEGEVNQYVTISNSGDTANIWRDSPTAFLMTVAPYNKITFEIPSDSSFYDGDSFVFGLTSTFVYQEGSKDGVMLVASHYEDTTLVQTGHFTSDGVTQVRLQPHEGKLKSLQGFIYLGRGNSQSESVKMLFISDIQLIRIHRKELFKDKDKKKEEEKDEEQPKPTKPQMRPDKKMADTAKTAPQS